MVLISTLGLFFKSWDKHINIKILDIKESLLKKNFAEKKIQIAGNKGTKCFYDTNINLSKGYSSSGPV